MLARMDMLSLIFIIIGSIIVYGSEHILDLFKINYSYNDLNVVIVKLIGLLIACIGFFRILDIF